MTVPHRLAQLLPQLFGPTADRLAVSCGFTRRRSKITGGRFAAGLVLGWLHNADARLQELVGDVACRGQAITVQALHQRFTPAATELMRQLLAAALQEAVQATEPAAWPLLGRFPAVVVFDCTQAGLPADFADLFPGCGGQHLQADEAATLKIGVGWELLSGQLQTLSLHPGRAHDRTCLPPPSTLAPGTLRVTDLGFFALGALAAVVEAGCHFLSRLQAGTCLQHGGRWWRQLEFLEAHGPRRPGATASWAVRLGKQARLPARLMVERVPDAVAAERVAKLREEAVSKGQAVSPERLAMASWTVLITDLDEERLTVVEALALYRVRWQIELLFRSWKSVGGLGVSRSRKPDRILCEQYAKLLALLVQQWLLLCGERPAAYSVQKAIRVVRHAAGTILWLLRDRRGLIQFLRSLDERLRGCLVSPRKKQPSTYQRLAAGSSTCLA